MDFYGTATLRGFSITVLDLSKVEYADYDKFFEIALRNGVDLSKLFVDTIELKSIVVYELLFF